MCSWKTKEKNFSVGMSTSIIYGNCSKTSNVTDGVVIRLSCSSCMTLNVPFMFSSEIEVCSFSVYYFYMSCSLEFNTSMVFFLQCSRGFDHCGHFYCVTFVLPQNKQKTKQNPYFYRISRVPHKAFCCWYCFVCFCSPLYASQYLACFK